MRTSFVRSLLVAVLFVFAASSCSGSDSSADSDQASTESSQAVNEPTATPVPPTPTPVPPTPADEPADEAGDEPESPGPENSSLIEIMLLSIGVSDVESTVECIVATAEDEGMTEDDLMAGTGAPVFVAALRCSDEVAEQMVASSLSFDTTGTDLTLDDVVCVQTASLDYLKVLPLADSEDLFSTPAPPDAMIDSIVDVCGVDRDDALRVMDA